MAVDVEAARLSVTIEASEPIKGWVAGPSGEARQFTGWLALISTLQQELARARPTPRPAPTEEGRKK